MRHSASYINVSLDTQPKSSPVVMSSPTAATAGAAAAAAAADASFQPAPAPPPPTPPSSGASDTRSEPQLQE
jgi:hypothetical protein